MATTNVVDRYSDRFARVQNGANFAEWAYAALNGNKSASPIGFTDAKKIPGMLFTTAVGIFNMTPEQREAAFPAWAVDVASRYWRGDVNSFNERNARKLMNLFAEHAKDWYGYLEAVQAYEAYAARGYKEAAPTATVAAATVSLAELSAQYPGISLADAMAILDSRAKAATGAEVKRKSYAQTLAEKAG